MRKITVLGIGNILLKDEGFGVRVAEQLLKRFQFPEHVQVLDGGTLGMDLMRFLLGTRQLILIDAVSGSLPPGSLYELRGQAVKTYFKEKVSLHDIGIQEVLAAMEVLEKPVKEIVIFGVEPAAIDVGLELSPIVAPSVEAVIERIIAELNSWQVEVVCND